MEEADVPRELVAIVRENISEDPSETNEWYISDMIAYCEENGIEDKVDAIIEAHRVHYYQKVDQELEEVRAQLRVFIGL